LHFHAITGKGLTDPARVRQILINLLSNAIKFSDGTAENPAKITVTLIAGEDGGINLTIKDEGVGIAESDLARLFQPFQQAEQQNSRKYGGTGLGLSIVRNLVELMGARFRLKVRLGRDQNFSYAFRLIPIRPRQFHLIRKQMRFWHSQTIKQCAQYWHQTNLPPRYQISNNLNKSIRCMLGYQAPQKRHSS
jgi:hypothetical protein